MDAKLWEAKLIEMYGEEEGRKLLTKYSKKEKRNEKITIKSNGRNEPLDINEYPIPDRRETK